MRWWRQVREYQGQSSGVKEAQQQAATARASTADLDQEVQEAWEEMQTQRAIVDTCASLPADPAWLDCSHS